MNREREVDGLARLSPCSIKVLGQLSLFLDEDFSRKVPLAATADVDALFVGEWVIRSEFKRILGERGISYEELSGEKRERNRDRRGF